MSYRKRVAILSCEHSQVLAACVWHSQLLSIVCSVQPGSHPIVNWPTFQAFGEGFGSRDHCKKPNFQGVIKLAASAASRKTKSRRPRSREAPGRRLGMRTAAGRGASLDLGPLDLVFLEAALAADLITASTSKTSKRVTNLSKTTTTLRLNTQSHAFVFFYTSYMSGVRT